jgi:hypothetical protein
MLTGFYGVSDISRMLFWDNFTRFCSDSIVVNETRLNAKRVRNIPMIIGFAF